MIGDDNSVETLVNVPLHQLRGRDLAAGTDGFGMGMELHAVRVERFELLFKFIGVHIQLSFSVVENSIAEKRGEVNLIFWRRLPKYILPGSRDLLRGFAVYMDRRT